MRMYHRLFHISAYVAALLTGLSLVSLRSEAYERRTPIVEAVEKALPAVVNISTTKLVKVNRPLYRNSPYRQLFEQTLKLEGLGSGVALEGGYIVTNYHVISYKELTADKIFVTFYGETVQREATIIGGDQNEDVVILKVEGEQPESFLTWGRSDDLMIGETVIAIGNALGQEFTVTDGIISALERSIEGEKGILNNLIQTNADINQGNSGGPLVNINGEFIGLNTVIISPSGGSVGLGFAIPVSRVKKVYDYWINGILSLEDQLGVVIQDMTPGLELFYKKHYPTLNKVNIEGIVTLSVPSSGSSLNALKQRDIIQKVDGKTIKNSAEFSRIEGYRDRNMTLSVVRDGQVIDIIVPSPVTTIEKTKWIGMTVQPLDSPWRKWLTLEGSESHLVVLDVEPESASAHAGIQRGDLLTYLDQAELKSLHHLKEALKATAGNKDRLLQTARKVNRNWKLRNLRLSIR